jgi:hypothetical protein
MQDFSIQPQYVRPRLTFEADRFCLALRIQDRSLAVGIGDSELGFGFAIRPRHRLLCLEADTVDRVLRGNGFVLGLDRCLDRGSEALRISDPGDLEIDNLDPVKPAQVGQKKGLERRR